MSPRRPDPVTVLPLAAAAIATLVALAPGDARAQCDYPFLGSGGAVYYPFGTNYYPTVVQSTNYWSVIAVRPDAGTDWDISAHSTAVLFPNCVSGTYATSVRGGSEVDLVIGDFNHNPQGTFYVRPYHFGGGGGATIEWDDGADQLQINGQRIERQTGPNDVVEAWDVFLEAGRNYSFDLRSGGSNLMTMLIYKNPANTPYWSNRNGAYWAYDQPANSSTIGGIVVDQTDWYGVVMVNRNGGSGYYHLLLETCTTPTALVSSGTPTAVEPGRHYTLQQTQPRFTAVGARGNSAVQYWTVDLGENANGVAPWCYATHRAHSSETPGTVSYVVGDFSAGGNPIGGVNNVRVHCPFGLGGTVAAVEWDEGSGSVVVNAPPIVSLVSSSDVLRVWNTALEGGYRYQVRFEQTGGLNLALFDNPGGLYWVPRSSASMESDTTFYFDAPRTDEYGLVLSKDSATENEAFALAVNRCALTDIVSEEANFVATPPGDDGHYELQVGEASWAAVSLLSTSGSQDWTLDLYADRVGAPPSCFSGLLQTSATPSGQADLIVGRPNLGGGGSQFFARARPESGTSANAVFQWEQGTEALVVGGPLLLLPAGAGHNVQCWDVNLTAGVTYDFTLNRTGGADVRLLLFRPTDLAQDGAWKNRAEAEFDVTGNTSYLAPASGTYGVVAVDDNGATGSFEVGVAAQSPVAVDPGETPLVTRLERIVPHPVTHDGRIHYALARAGEVKFEIVNAAGRRVAEIAEGAREAGMWSAAWSGRSADGRALASGVYFVRMRVDGVRVADARLVQLP